VPADPIGFARALIRCPSVTPAEGGALAYLADVLTGAGFKVARPVFSESGTADVENLWARIGTDPPHLLFAGHTDVVPPGDPAMWRYPPFAAEMIDGQLYGRGAVDMKGAIACFLAATLDLLADHAGRPRGSISLLMTGDEEGPGINGTAKLMAWATQRGERFDHCLLGEPTNPTQVGEMIKIGRRGSLNGTLIVAGKQGHVAYPQLCDNPISHLVTLMSALMSEKFDEGSEHFEPSHLEFTSVDVGNTTVNLIPGEARAHFNIRFNDCHSQESLKDLIRARCAQLLRPDRWRLIFESSTSEPFLTQPGPFVDLVSAAIADVTGRTPVLSTSGGTSDARHIHRYCPVVEFGLVGQTMHQVDEHVAIGDFATLTAIYRRILARYFLS